VGGRDPVSDRYAGVVEHSVYVPPAARGRDVASTLLKALAGSTGSTERTGIWTIQSGIFPENTASLAVHQQAGFRSRARRCVQRVTCPTARGPLLSP
jgi:phosphinothricin acetyltransferase